MLLFLVSVFIWTGPLFCFRCLCRWPLSQWRNMYWARRSGSVSLLANIRRELLSDWWAFFPSFFAVEVASCQLFKGCVYVLSNECTKKPQKTTGNLLRHSEVWLFCLLGDVSRCRAMWARLGQVPGFLLPTLWPASELGGCRAALPYAGSSSGVHHDPRRAKLHQQ